MEGSSTTVVTEPLSESNYEDWSIQVKTYLLGQDLWEVVEADEPTAGQAKIKAWRKKNALALHAIQITSSSQAFSDIKKITSAKSAWNTLEEKYGPKSDEHKEPANDSEIQQQSNSSTNEAPAESNIIPPGSSSDQNNQNNINSNDGDFQLHQRLFKAVSLGDWDTAKTLLDQNPDAVRARGPVSGKNALHIAVTEEHLHIVEKLVERMTKEDLETRREDGFTPLEAAIEVGNMSIAKCLIRKNRKLVSIIHRFYGLPASQAIKWGKKEMVIYLYSVTPLEDLKSFEERRHVSDFLSRCILAKYFDIALHLLERAPDLAVTEGYGGTSPTFLLSYTKVFTSGSSLRFWQRWIYDCIHIRESSNHISVDIQNLEQNQRSEEGIVVISSDVFHCLKNVLLSPMRWMVSILLKLLDVKKIYKMKLVHVQILELLSFVCKVIHSSSDETQIKKVRAAIIEAVYHENVEFIKRVTKANPELVWIPGVALTVLELAVILRQPKIYSLIYGLRDKIRITNFCDQTRSAMLHKVASIAPSRLLNRIPGAALQMQRELQWFKEVESMSLPEARELRNHNSLKPWDIFTESHKDLVSAGEKWMKDTSSSCSVVGALIITVTFAALFTVPGGNNQNTGIPMFLSQKLFKVFMVSDAVALSASTTSVLMFLAILTSRYAEEDFLVSLPTKLIIGLSTLFLSIAAMIVAFCAGLSIMFGGQSLIFLPSVCIAIIPVASFVWMQFPLLVDIFLSTYGPSIFDRKVKYWM